GEHRYYYSIDVKTGTARYRPPGSDRYDYALTSSPDGKTVFVGARSSEKAEPLVYAQDPVVLNDLRSGVPLANSRVLALEWSAALNAIVGAITTTKTQRLVVIDPRTLEVKQTIFDERPGDGASTRVLFSADGMTVGEQLTGKTMRIWDLTTGKQTFEYKGDKQIRRFVTPSQLLA